MYIVYLKLEACATVTFYTVSLVHDLLGQPSYVISGVCLLCFRARLFIVALWSPAGKGLTSWLSFLMSYCEFATFLLVSLVRCGT